MRFLIKAEMPVERANELAEEGKLGKTLGMILDDLKPEAAYFSLSNGERTAFIFVNVDDPAEIPVVAEPFFLALDANLEIVPAMNPEDLKKAGPAIEKAAKKYA